MLELLLQLKTETRTSILLLLSPHLQPNIWQTKFYMVGPSTQNYSIVTPDSQLRWLEIARQTFMVLEGGLPTLNL